VDKLKNPARWTAPPTTKSPRELNCRKGVVIGTLGGSSVLAGAAFVFFVLAFMAVFVADELNDQNDVVSASIQRRSMKVVQNMLTTNKVCSASAAKGVTCKTKRISNKALRSLQKSGITAIYKDGSYGGAMKGLMKGQVAKLSDADIKALADYMGK
jgi:cytochrome c553